MMAGRWTRQQAQCRWTVLLTAPLLLSLTVGQAFSTHEVEIPTVLNSSAVIASKDRDVGPLLVVPSGEEAMLFAVVMGDPCPTVRWRLNGTGIIQSDAYNVSDPCPPPSSPRSTFYNFTLTINVTMETTGNYTAQLINTAGTTDVTGVFVTPPVPVQVTGLQILSRSPCLLNGTSVIVRCVTSGFPRPQITFNRVSMPITVGVGTFSNFEQLDFDTVSITAAQSDDQGVYSCTASSGGTELDRSSDKRLLFCTLPIIVGLTVPETLMEGETNVVLGCSSTGIPISTIQWEKDGEVFTPGGSRRVNSSQPGQSQLEIGILLISDAGVYTCVSTNTAGQAMQSGRMTVEAQLPPPLLTVGQITGIAVGGAVGILIVTMVITILLCYTKGTPYHSGSQSLLQEHLELDQQPRDIAAGVEPDVGKHETQS